MFPFNTARLTLRQFQLEDDRSLHETVFGDPDVMNYGDGVHTLEWTRAWIETCLHDYYATRGYGPYAVVEQRSQRLLGYCGLFYFPDVNRKPEVEIGYRLARSAWGKGYANEAALAIRDHAFNNLKMKRLIAIIDPSNTASIRVAEKVGMRYEQDVLFEGYTHPDHVYAIDMT